MQSMSMVGKYVTVSTTNSTGSTVMEGGFVDMVTIKTGKAYVVINGSEYPAENVTEVYDETYLAGIVAGDQNQNGGQAEEEKTQSDNREV